MLSQYHISFFITGDYSNKQQLHDNSNILGDSSFDGDWYAIHHAVNEIANSIDRESSQVMFYRCSLFTVTRFPESKISK